MEKMVGLNLNNDNFNSLGSSINGVNSFQNNSLSQFSTMVPEINFDTTKKGNMGLQPVVSCGNSVNTAKKISNKTLGYIFDGGVMLVTCIASGIADRKCKKAIEITEENGKKSIKVSKGTIILGTGATVVVCRNLISHSKKIDNLSLDCKGTKISFGTQSKEN